MRFVSLERAAEILQASGVVAYPTETFYALGVNPKSKVGVERLLEMKGRSLGSGVPLIIDSMTTLSQVIAEEEEKVKRERLSVQRMFWPGALTLVITVREELRTEFCEGIFGEDFSIAVRVSSSKVARTVAQGAGGLLTSTSANPKAQDPASRPEEVAAYFPDLAIVKFEAEEEQSSLVSNDLFDIGLPSTILDVRQYPFRILRRGAVAEESLSPWLSLVENS